MAGRTCWLLCPGHALHLNVRALRRLLTSPDCLAKLIVLSRNKVYWQASSGLSRSRLPHSMWHGAFSSLSLSSSYLLLNTASSELFFLSFIISVAVTLCLARGKSRICGQWPNHMLFPLKAHWKAQCVEHPKE